MNRTNRLVACAALALAAVGAVATTPPATPPAKPDEKPAAPAAVPPKQPAEPAPAIKTTALESGLVLEDLRMGDGPEVTPGAAVEVHYRGTFKDGGEEFDSSDPNQPAIFVLGEVIKGWQEGIPGMRVGG